MKTNASPKTVVQAVETVSKRHFDGNVVLRRSPEKMTKNVSRFTLKTLEADKPGSLVTKQGVKQTKADWSVHQEIMHEILRLDPRPHIYVDTVYGREYNKTPKPLSEVVGEQQPEQTKQRKTRKPRHASQVSNTDNSHILNIVQAIKYILNNPAVLTE